MTGTVDRMGEIESRPLAERAEAYDAELERLRYRLEHADDEQLEHADDEQLDRDVPDGHDRGPASPNEPDAGA